MSTIIEEKPVVLPTMTADWYDSESIAQLEIDSLPEFFSGLYPSKTPVVYKEYREFIIALGRM